MATLTALLDQYTSDHQNPKNVSIHLFCVPAIVWSVSALLWCIPVPAQWLNPGFWGALTMFTAWAYYWRKSRSLSIGLLLIFTLFGFINRYLLYTFGIYNLLYIALAVFAVAWVGQFIGHHIEGKRPSFLTDMVYLLVGPMWTLSKLYTKLGVRF